MNADQFLEQLTREGGVIVSGATLTSQEITDAGSCGKLYVTPDCHWFVHLPGCAAHPKDPPTCGREGAATQTDVQRIIKLMEAPTYDPYTLRLD